MGRVRAIVANIGSAVMMEAPPSAYLRSLAAVTPRKLWQAWPGDCVVTLAPCSDVFCDYVSGVLEMDVGDVDIVAPRELRGGHPLEFAAELGAADIVAARGALSPFVLDDPVLAFAQRTGMTIVPYASLPDATTLDTVRRINTKRGFREIASSLGLPVAVGGYAATPAELVVQLEVFLRGHTRAIVKIDRASNGCGNTVIAGDAAVAVAEQVRDMLAGQPQRGCGWVFEEYLPLDSVPSIEMRRCCINAHPSPVIE